MVYIRTMVLVLFSLTLFFVNTAFAAPPELAGEAGVVMDAGNGQILYQKNAGKKLYPASTTKILTAVIALEQSDLDEMVTVTENAVGVEGTAIGLQKDEKLPMRSLMYALLLNSANDAAVAIAEHISGSVEEFASLMNKKASELGAKDSHFVNPHGLTEAHHKTTARDLAVIARYAMQNDKFREIVATLNKEIKRGVPEEKEPQIWTYNHNRLLTTYSGATGIKTGYTSAAELCIVGAAKRDERELIAVVLKSPTQNTLYSDVSALLDYGFDEFEPRKLVEKGEIIMRIDVPHGTKGLLVEAKDSLIYNFPVGAPNDITKEVKPVSGLNAPVKEGDVVGKVLIYNGDKQTGQVDLLALEDIPRKITHNWWFWPSVGGVTLLTLRIWIRARRRRKRYMFLQRRRRW